jgi:squalene synthase HpnC
MNATALPGEWSGATPTVAESYAWCRRFARARSENFTVVSAFLPRGLRTHFFALYAYCRYTDDLGDEASGDRLHLLDLWEAELRACYAGRRDHPLFVALGHTIDGRDIPQEPFLRLIESNRIDQRRSCFQTYDELLDYCSYSATPVGRMVLCVLGYRDEQRQQLADATCTGLQLANFWQDVSVDLAKGRIYIPIEDLHRYGLAEDDLRAGIVSERFRALMRFEIERARALFVRGRALEPLVDRRTRTDIRLFRLGGEAVLDAIVRADYDVQKRRPRVAPAKKLRMALVSGLRLQLGI